MKLLLLKFNYGVEIGARQAYLGHYGATGDASVLEIANEELEHQRLIAKILKYHGHKPFVPFNVMFTVIGFCIRALCYISPRFLLNFVARSMEIFAVFSYEKLARLFPAYESTFLEMAETERRHEEYFNVGIKANNRYS